MADLTTLTPAELAERAAKCLGWRIELDAHQDPFWYGSTGRLTRRQWSPATDDNQAAELMRAAVAKCGATAFRHTLCRIWYASDSDVAFDVWLATADARARTLAALRCLEPATKEGG